MRNGLTHELKNISAIFCDFLKTQKTTLLLSTTLVKKIFFTVISIGFFSSGNAFSFVEMPD
jgi:hypothetical protein